uniref:Uncharacterized protein n=1 Tax=Anopheles maculatus TaxID=74869 RepID=A0A182S698_9DIPT
MAEQINSKLHSQQHVANNNSRLAQSALQQNGATAGGDGGKGSGSAGGIKGAGSASLQSNDSVDLDNLFAFLSEVQPNPNSNAIIDEIGEKMDNLVEDLDVELESVIQQEIEGLTSERNNNVSAASTLKGGPLVNGTGATTNNNNNNNNINNNKPTTPKPLGGVPSLPEPTMPPPPPPIENNNHTLPAAQPHHPATLHHIRRHEEPIYEAVIHLKELPPPPLDAHEKVPPIPQHQPAQVPASAAPQHHPTVAPPPPVHAHQQPVPPPHAHQPPMHQVPPQSAVAHQSQPEAAPQPPPHAHAAPSHAYVHLENGSAGHKLRPKSPAVIRSASPIQRTGSNGPMSPSSPKHSRPSSRASSTGGGHPFAEREQRRKYRVEKKLQEMQQMDITEREKELLRDDVYYDILE